jgi:hypothetical protein
VLPLFTELPRTPSFSAAYIQHAERLCIRTEPGSFGGSGAQKEGQGIATASLAPYPFPQGVVSRINMQMSVPGLTKCHRAQTLFVIGVTITLVTSCWTEDYSSFSFPKAANN